MPPIEDLYDFYQRWPEMRPFMEALAQSPRLNSREQDIMRAMLTVVDRVGPDDLGGDSTRLEAFEDTITH